MIEQQKPKRKTHTSNEVKRRYNEKTYDRLVIVVRKEKAERYKLKCKEKGIPLSEPLHGAIDAFLEEKNI